MFDENNDRSTSSTFYQDLKLSKHDDKEVDRAESIKASAKILSHGTLNQPNDIVDAP